MQETNDVVALAFVDWKARMRRVDDLMQHLFCRVMDVDHVHSGCIDHDVACSHVGHAQHAFEHDAAFCTDDLLVFGL